MDSKAEIVNTENGERLVCHFNPNTYSFDKKNNWPTNEQAGSNMPQHKFGGGSPATLTMELLFDTYADAKPGADPEDVRVKYTDKLWKLMLVDPKLKNYDKKSKKGRPPQVKFIWGKTWSFEGVITSLSQKFTLFMGNGIPVRATVNVTFQQSKDEAALAKQNPTSGGIGGDRVWTVIEGDTLGWIAYKEYGDTSMWRLIAEANRLEQVRRLTPGTVLVIPNG
jgi:hypothetical protein